MFLQPFIRQITEIIQCRHYKCRNNQKNRCYVDNMYMLVCYYENDNIPKLSHLKLKLDDNHRCLFFSTLDIFIYLIN